MVDSKSSQACGVLISCSTALWFALGRWLGVEWSSSQDDTKGQGGNPTLGTGVPTSANHFLLHKDSGKHIISFDQKRLVAEGRGPYSSRKSTEAGLILGLSQRHLFRLIGTGLSQLLRDLNITSG